MGKGNTGGTNDRTILPADSHTNFRIASAMRKLRMPTPGERPVSPQVQQNNSNWPRQKTHHDRWQKSTSMLIAAAKTPPMSLKLVPFVRHTESMKGKIALARQQLGIIGERVEQFEHEAHALNRVALKDTELTGYVEKFFPTKVKP